MKVIPYISFNGNCQEALEFYHSILGGKLAITYFNEIPEEEGVPISEHWKDKVMHSSITFPEGDAIYLGDTWEEAPVEIGDNTTIHLAVKTEEEVYDFVEKLSVGGEITMPADKTFWNSVYGSLVDRFGISWGIEFALE